MTDQKIIELIEKEFKEKSLAVTEQYLEIHNPVYINNKLQVDRIDREAKDDVIIVYLPVVDERFCFSVYINLRSEEIISVGTESYNCVLFRADSERFSLEELSEMTSFKFIGGRNKGDKRGTTLWKESAIFFEPNPKADEFHDKLKKLLDLLESDRKGTKKLVKDADGYMQVAMEIHNGNGMLCGPYIDKKEIRRMNDLGLSINFDLYVSGNSFKD